MWSYGGGHGDGMRRENWVLCDDDVYWRSQCDVVHRQEYEMDGDHLKNKTNTKSEDRDEGRKETGGDRLLFSPLFATRLP